MFGIQHYGSFVLAILLFQIVPGAGTIGILDATAREGRAAGMAAVLGTVAGDAVFMVAAVLGLAAVLQAHPLLFQALQWVGAAYLCWLGLKLLLTRARHESPAAAPPTSRWKHLRRAMAISLTNPKVMLFFLAFFPLFLTPGASAGTLLAMMAHVTSISLLYLALVVCVGNSVARRLRHVAGARRATRCGAGLALLGMGVKLVLSGP